MLMILSDYRVDRTNGHKNARLAPRGREQIARGRGQRDLQDRGRAPQPVFEDSR